MRDRIQPTINAGSMADIAFLLLLFFLVSTNIKNPKGLQVLLPPWDPTKPTKMNEEEVLTVQLNKENLVLLENEVVPIDQISQYIRIHIEEKLSTGQQPIISLVTDTSAIYQAYIKVYDQIKSAYSELRDEAAQSKYGKPYDTLIREKRHEINKSIPMVISEADYYL